MLFNNVFISSARMNWLQLFIYQTAQSQLFLYCAEEADSQAVSSGSLPSAQDLENVCHVSYLSLSQIFFLLSHLRLPSLHPPLRRDVLLLVAADNLQCPEGEWITGRLTIVMRNIILFFGISASKVISDSQQQSICQHLLLGGS